MARKPIIGGDAGNWGTILNDFLNVEHNDDGTQKTLSIDKGGTGATNAADARANLGIASSGAQMIYIQNSPPIAPGPYIWVQTGLGTGGTDMTFWVEDGT